MAVILGTAVMIFPAVPCVTILVVRMVMGLLEPGGGRAHSQPHSMKNKQLQRYVVHFLHLLHPGVQILGWS